jgi:hypothetical protein
MKTDAYTKVVLTGIAVFLGVIAFDYKPTINAQAASSGGSEMIADISNLTGATKKVWHLQNGKIRSCFAGGEKPACGGWSD